VLALWAAGCAEPSQPGQPSATQAKGQGKAPNSAPAHPPKALPQEEPAQAPPAPVTPQQKDQSAETELVKALGDDDALIRKQAALALKELGIKARHAIPALKKALQDSDADVRATAKAALKVIDVPFSLQELVEQVRDPIQPAETRRAACLELAERFWKEKTTTQTLQRALTDKVVKSAAAKGLGRIERLRGRRLRWDCNHVLTAAISPDGKILAGAVSGNDQERRILVWDVDREKEMARIPFSGNISLLAFSGDGKALAWCCLSNVDNRESSVLTLWDLKAGKVLHTLRWKGICSCMVFSGDGKTLAACGSLPRSTEPGKYPLFGDSLVTLWDVTTGYELRSFQQKEEKTRCLAISADGRTVTAAGLWYKRDTRRNWIDFHVIRVWDVGSAKELRTLKGTQEDVRALAISADGKTFAARHTNGIVRWWDVATRKQLNAFKGYFWSIQAPTAVTPDGKFVVVVAWGVQSWQVATGKQLRSDRFEGSGTRGFVRTVAISADGSTLMVADNLGNVRVWDMAAWTQPAASGSSLEPE
jgi:WD40 repeat protein